MTLIRIEEIKSDKIRYLPLLLIGDEPEVMIEQYLDRGRLFVGMIGNDTVLLPLSRKMLMDGSRSRISPLTLLSGAAVSGVLCWRMPNHSTMDIIFA